MDPQNARSMILFRHWVAEQVLSSSLKHLEELPPIERAILHHVLKGESQTSAARTLGISQPSISYRVRKALWRLEILWLYPRLTQAQVRAAIRASGYRATGAPLEKMLVKAVALLLKTTCQTHAAAEFGRSQGWLRYQATKLRAHLRAERDKVAGARSDFPAPPVSTAWDSLLTAMDIVAEHGNIFAIQTHQVTPLRGEPPSSDVVWKVATRMMLISVPPKGRDRVVTSDAEIEALCDLLRAHGPLLRSAALEILEKEGHDGNRITRAAVRKKKVYSRQTGRRGTRAPIGLQLLPPAAVSVRGSFKIDWHGAVKDFCAVYDIFAMSGLTRHLGLAGSPAVIRDNAVILSDLVRAQGFKETGAGEWARRRTSR